MHAQSLNCSIRTARSTATSGPHSGATAGGTPSPWLGSRPHPRDGRHAIASAKVRIPREDSPVLAWRAAHVFGNGSTRTGRRDCRITASATLPSASRLTPVRPCVVMTIRST